ncbi:MAG: sensor domain-containing protein [Longimicrobiales bacterium]
MASTRAAAGMSRRLALRSLSLRRSITQRDRFRREAQHSLSLLQATLESTTDGILVAGLDGRVVSCNRRFLDMWGLPAERARGPASVHAVLASAAALVDQPTAFLASGERLNAEPESESYDVVRLNDGRVLERYSRPQRLDGSVIGRVWSFRDVTDRRNAEAALLQSERRYRTLFENSRQPIYISTEEGTLLSFNRAALEMLGYTFEEMSKLNARDLYADPAQREAFREQIERRGFVRNFPIDLVAKDGRTRHCLITTHLRRDDRDTVTYQGLIEDVTERRLAEEALRRSERYFRSLIENALDTITLLNRDGTIRYESPSVERVLGYRPEELLGQDVFEYIHLQDRPAARALFESLLSKSGGTASTEVRFRHADGSWRVLEVVGRNLLEDPAVEGVVVNAHDVTERKRAEEQLRFDAFHDKLTGLPNRALFTDRLAQLLRRRERDPDLSFAVLFLDLDGFKLINDGLGHFIGDQLLVGLARRLEHCLRPGDTVARLGGDEFTIILDGSDAVDEVAAIADRIHQQLQRPFQLEGHEVFTTASIGVALSGPEHERPEDLVRDADSAMYRAKTLGRGRYAVFDRTMHADALARLQLETDLRRALERDELVLHYQPIIDLRSERLAGFEALIRWRHASAGLLPPADFLGIAEETGLIIPIGWWVLEEALRQTAEWRRSLPPSREPVISVNLSGRQLMEADLVDRVEAVLRRTGMEPGWLHLEITEGAIMERADAIAATLRSLKEIGVRLSIDDFGTGYSSLSYLHAFPTDTVKIDRSFTHRLGQAGRNAEIIRTILGLAHQLGMTVVAEGIETAAQHEELRSLRCEFGQGFLWSRAVPADEAGRMIARTGW